MLKCHVGSLKLASARAFSPWKSASATKQAQSPLPRRFISTPLHSRHAINAAITVNARKTHVDSKCRNRIHPLHGTQNHCLFYKKSDITSAPNRSNRKMNVWPPLVHGACHLDLLPLLIELGAYFVLLLVTLVIVWLIRMSWLKSKPTEKKESLGNRFCYFQAGEMDCQSTNTEHCARVYT